MFETAPHSTSDVYSHARCEGRDAILSELFLTCRDRFVNAARLLRAQDPFIEKVVSAKLLPLQHFSAFYSSLWNWYVDLRAGDMLQQRFGETAESQMQRCLNEWRWYGYEKCRGLAEINEIVWLVLEAVIYFDSARGQTAAARLADVAMERVRREDREEYLRLTKHNVLEND